MLILSCYRTFFIIYVAESSLQLHHSSSTLAVGLCSVCMLISCKVTRCVCVIREGQSVLSAVEVLARSNQTAIRRLIWPRRKGYQSSSVFESPVLLRYGADECSCHFHLVQRSRHPGARLSCSASQALRTLLRGTHRARGPATTGDGR